jgi:hypothetical protein
LGFGYLVLATQTRAIGASSIDEDEKIYLTCASTTGENGLTNLHLENSKDKVLLVQPMLIMSHSQNKTICSYSDFLTITRTRIYKSQNDP